MKNRYLLIIILVLSVVAIISSREKSASFYNEEEKDPEQVSVYDPQTQKTSNLDLEEYVIGVVAAEMPASFNDEALKAQAVAARTYAVYKMEHATREYDLIADISNQAYITIDKMKIKWNDEFNKYYEKIKKAVSATENLIMTYNDETIISYYFAMSNGSTENVSQVFGEQKDYLTSVDSSWDKSVNNYEVINTISKIDFCTKLNISCDAIKISNIQKSNTGRVNSININGKNFKGTKVRTLLGLRSTDFNIEITDVIKITTKGYGHGVGMSQYGANEMAKLGYKYDEILKYYYQNIELKQVNV